MKKTSTLFSLVLRTILLCSVLSYFPVTVKAQFPVCDSMVYFISSGSVYNLNTYQPISATNPVLNTFPTLGGISLAVSANLNSTSGPSPTFYGVIGSNYVYYDGTTWVNTGHTSGSVDIGAGGGYIYGKTGASIYRYDGTANATIIATLPAAVNVFDIAADCDGNFYVLDLGTSALLKKYSPTGTFLYQWTVLGGPASAICFSLSGNQLLVGSAPVYAGVVDPASTTINLTALGTIPLAIDFGGCPFMFSPAVTDTFYQCTPTQSFTLTASGNTPYSAAVISGSATITGTGPNFTAVPSGLTTVVLSSTSTGCGTGPITTDTFVLVPPPAIDAGTSDTLFDCGIYQDTLHGVLSNSQSWVTYQYAWTPVAAIASGATTPDPVITPTANTMYYLKLTTGASQGNCQLTDSVFVPISNQTINPDFTFSFIYGCDADSVVFHNTTPGSDQWEWDFGDGQISTLEHPVHRYNQQDNYTVRLFALNNYCADSVLKMVNTKHPLDAAFTVSKDTLCQGDTIQLNNTSTVFLQPATCGWNFGDGTTGSNCNTTHSYGTPGTYQISLVVSDNISCRDTAYQTITVDSMPELEMTIDRHSLCTGESVQLGAKYTREGNNYLSWDFGDASDVRNVNPTSHAYDRAGIYFITLLSTYRVCNELSIRDSVIVYNLPNVFIGPDTTICLHGNPIFLSNQLVPEPGTRYLWSTGDTTNVLKVTHHGTYNLIVTSEHGCAAKDEIVISKDCYTDIPNSFTPNGDGINDYFFPRQFLSLGVTSFSMSVFNRWGQVVFKTEVPDGRGWDGKFNEKEQPSGVYIYQIQVTFKNGRSESYDGNVTLMR
jgi:gliding motility-associated-like protein